MSVFLETKWRLRQIILPVIGIVLLTYLSYHLIQGQRGLLSHARLIKETEAATITLETLKTERLAFEHRISLLSGKAPDLDMLEEQTRKIFNYMHADDLLIYETSIQ